MIDNNFILTCENLSFKYSQNSQSYILKDFNMKFEKSKTYLITGDSGCGKSTLAYILSGLYPVNKGYLESGEIFYKNVNITTLPIEERVKKIMIMFQNSDSQFSSETPREEIIFCLENINFPKQLIDSKIKEVLSILEIEELEFRNINSLSGGEKQKVALSCILAIEPEIIILDEPFANIDETSAISIVSILKKISEEKKITLIIVDHRLNYWKTLNYDIISIKNNLLEKNIIEIENLTLKNENKEILSSANLSIKENSMNILTGKSGSGKTSLLLALCKNKKIPKNTIKIFGKYLEDFKEKEFINQIGIVFQNPNNQFITYKVIDEILFTLKKNFPNVEEETLIEKAEKLLEEFNLLMYKDASPFSLSQGQQRKLGVLSMICSNQKLLLLDEPTYGQDKKTSLEIMSFLRKKVDKENFTLLIVTHDLEIVSLFCDNIYTITDEKKIEEGVL